MDGTQFLEKLRKIDSRFWLDRNNRQYRFCDEGSAGLYFEENCISGCPQGYIPERTVYNENGTVKLKGWKDILDGIVRKFGRGKLRREFGYPS